MTDLKANNVGHDFDEQGIVQALQHRLTELIDQGAQNVEPGLVRLLETMQDRYESRPSRHLLLRMQQSLATLERRFQQVKRSAQAAAAAAGSANREFRESIDKLIKTGRWLDARYLALKAQADNTAPARQIRALREQVIKGELINPAQAGALSFDDFLMSQEQEILATIRDQTISAATDDSESDQDNQPQSFAPDQPAELRSIKHFRESWVKLNSEKLLAQAIAEMPKDAGPLNSHRLAIKSLTAMRDLSPEYLNRFLSYLETLLWLEKAGESIGVAARSRVKKSGSGK